MNSRVLGSDSVDVGGRNAGLYERATGAEICDYYQRVLDEHLLASGQVRFFGMSDYVGDMSRGHQFVSRLTGAETTVRVRRKVVDATYLEPTVPATHTPSFEVDEKVRLIPINDLVDRTEPASGYTVIGGGKTAMDACIWLFENGVPADAIRWIRPRDAWLLDRVFVQPLTLLPSLIEGVSLNLEAAAEAEDVDELFARLEGCGQLVRLDPDVEPRMYRCATVSTDELESLRLIQDVVRQGRVTHIGADRIVLEEGTIPTDIGQLYVDCSAGGLHDAPGRPIFEPDRITLQQVRTCQPTFNAALVGFLESSRNDDANKNQLCPPNPYPNAAPDWVAATYIAQSAQIAWSQEADVVEWMEGSRLDAARGINDHLADSRMLSALTRWAANMEPAIANLDQLLAKSASR